MKCNVDVIVEVIGPLTALGEKETVTNCSVKEDMETPAMCCSFPSNFLPLSQLFPCICLHYIDFDGLTFNQIIAAESINCDKHVKSVLLVYVFKHTVI